MVILNMNRSLLEYSFELLHTFRGEEMTSEQRFVVKQMRLIGQSYSMIAKDMGISENTIKSYCRRNAISSISVKNMNNEKEIHIVCKSCAKPLVQGTKGQPKKFCSERCRRTWWKVNDGQLVKKAWYTLTCNMCGKEFSSYGNQNRKFCEHACYIKKRFEKAGNGNDT